MKDQTILGDSDLVAGNIKSGVNLFGVAGSLNPWAYPSNLVFGYQYSKNISSAGVCYLMGGVYGNTGIFFNSSLVTDSNGNVTLDGKTLNKVCYGYSLMSSLPPYNLTDWRSSFFPPSFSYSGKGVAYTNANSYVCVYYFNTSVGTNVSGGSVIDGVYVGDSLLGYGVPN